MNQQQIDDLNLMRRSIKKREEDIQKLQEKLEELCKMCDHEHPNGESSIAGFIHDECTLCGWYAVG